MRSAALRLSVTAVLAMLCGGAVLLADTLVLRDGRRIRGRLVNVRDGIVEFVEERFLSSRTLRVERDEVERIEFDDDYRPAESSSAAGARPRGLREKELAVLSTVAWNDTGIDVRPGQTLYFSSEGRVRWGPDRRDEAAGERNSPANPNRPIPRRPAAALIGKIGVDSNDYFFIGADQGPIQMRARGRLFLGINDDYLQDNAGGFRVTIYY